MSLNHSPSVVTDGLIMYYDQENKKSWRGAPANNQIVQITWTGDGVSQPQFPKGSILITDDDLKYNGLETYLYTPGVSLNCYLNGADLDSARTSTDWTFSCYIRRQDNANITVLDAYMYYPTSDGSASCTIIPVGDGWHYVYRTRSGAVNQLSLVGFVGFASNTKYYFSGAMLSKTSYPVYPSATNSVRSDTQAILDLTNNNTITATSLTYASDGTFSFDRANNNTLLTNLPITSTPALSNFTYEVFLIITSLPPASNNGVILGATYYAGAAIYWRTSGSNFNIKGFIRGNDAYRVTADYTLALNTVYHVVMTNNYSAGTLNLYINGVLFSSVATATQEYNDTLIVSAGNIGVNKPQIDGGGAETYSYFTGKVPVAKIYNRALSAAEVQQNFNALRGRYGI
jgi:hypothetical protein